MSRISSSPKSAQRGVVLIEAMVAILLFSIGVLAVAGLQASMLRNTSDSKYRADASYIAQQKIGLMWANPSGITAIINAGAVNVPDLPNGKISVSQPLTVGQFEIVITWQAPGDPQQHNYTVYTSIAGG